MIALALLLLAQLTGAQPLATLDGDVTGPRGQPIAGARIQVDPARPGVQPRTTLTDAGGHFRVTGLPEGWNFLFVSRAGYLRIEGRRLDLKPGEARMGVKVALTAQGVIAGKVFDAGGWPVVQARVLALRYEEWQGRRQVRPLGAPVTTDDLGRYRMSRVPAGQYYLVAQPGWPLSRWDERYAATFYPSAYRQADARLVSVSAGQEATGADITLLRLEGITVSGSVLGARPPLQVSLVPEDTTLAGSSTHSAYAERDGSFTIRHVPPGTYILVAGQDTTRYSTTLPELGLTAQQKLVVGDSDLPGLQLSLRPAAFDLAGKVSFEDHMEPVPVTITLSGTNSRRFSVTSAAGGSFTIPGVVPGRYRVETSWVPPRAVYFKSIRFAGQEVGEYLDLTGPSQAQLEVTASAAFAEVQGTVTDSSGRPAPGAYVVLVSGNRQTWPVDASGTFRRMLVPPGAYTALAVATSDQVREVDLDFLKAHAAQIRSVTLSAGPNPPLSLVAIQ